MIRKIISIGLAIALILAVIFIWVYMTKNSKKVDNKNTTTTIMNDTFDAKILKPGKGDVASINDKVTVNYTGWLKDGTKFDSSLDRNEPFSFNLGKGEVIEGWDKGVVGMKVGEIRRLTIPAEMGYGANAVGSIPANSTLIFEVELLKTVKSK